MHRQGTLMGMTEISVIVIDGQRTFADALAARLEAESSLNVVAATESAAAVHRLLVGRRVDVALLDAELPGSLPLTADLARARTAATQPVKVIMLGTVPDAPRIVEALRAGIAGWVRKEESIEHLLMAMQGVMRGETWLPASAVGNVLGLLLDQRDERAAARNHPLASLTPREREVLSYLAEGIGRREVAQRMDLSANTIRSHLQNLMAKLGVHTTLEAVALARRVQVREVPSRASWS
jgi:DNA-binding NarL/FixJ family response regulator